MNTRTSFLSAVFLAITGSALAVEYAGVIGTELDPGGFVSINRDTIDPGSSLGSAAFQSELTTAAAAGFGGVMFTGAGSSRTDITSLTGSYATGKDIRFTFSRVAAANYGTINQLSANGDSIVMADTGSNSDPITCFFQDLPAGERLAKLGFTLINRTGGTVAPVAEVTVHFADTTTLVLTDTIVNGDHDTDNTFFSIDGTTNGGIISVTFANSNGGRGFGIDGLAFITEESGPIITSPGSVVVVDASSGTGFHTLAATDPDAGTVSYAIIGGDDAGDFVLSGANGEILSYHPDGAALPAPFNLATPTDANLDNGYALAIQATSSVSAETSVQPLTVTVIPPTPPVVTPENIELSGDTGQEDTFLAGDLVSVLWNSGPTGDDSPGLSSVTVDFTEFGGPAAVPASPLPGAWLATYALPAGIIDTTGANVFVTAVNVNGSTTVESTANVAVDTEPPVVTDANLGIVSSGRGTGGEFLSGDFITLRWTDTGGDANADFIESVSFNLSAFGGGNNVPGIETSLGSGLWQATYTVTYNSNTGTGLNASVTVTDNAGNRTQVTDTTGVTIVKPEAVVGAVTGILDESVPSSLATWEFNLDTDPAGPVGVTATADDDSEISIDGINFSSSVTFTVTDTSPRVIAARVIDDDRVEGFHQSRISMAITSSGDPSSYPVGFPLESATIGVIDNDGVVDYHPLTLADQGAVLQGTFTQNPALAGQTWIVVGYAAENTSATSPVTAVEVIPPGAAAAPLPNSIYTGLLDARGHAGLWYEAFPALAGGTYTVNITTSTSPSQCGAVVWIVNGAVGVRDAGYIAYRDDENGSGPGTLGFNFSGTLARFSQSPTGTEPMSAVRAGDFVLGMAMLGEDDDRVAGALGEWDLVEEDINFSSGGYSSFQENVASDAPALGIALNNSYFRCLVAALAFEFPAPTDATTDSDGDGLTDAYELANGLDPGDPGDALSDPDGDGANALREFHFGTRENDPGSVFAIGMDAGPGGSLDVSYGPVFDGLRYELSSSADAVIFSQLETFDAPADAAGHVVVDPTLLDAEVYRVEVADQP